MGAALAFAAALVAIPAAGQSAPGAGELPTVEFQFENAQLQPARYTITLHADGTGRFHAEAGQAESMDSSGLPGQGQDRAIQVSAAATQRIFAIAHARHFFAMPCEQPGSHVAFTGSKQLSYSGPEGHGSCKYNYSKDDQIQWLTTEMQGIAGSLEEGRRLDLRHEHGRLSLDAELETLATMVHDGQALELGNIAPTLQAIVEDASVLERAQKRARQLLASVDAVDAKQMKK